jgi:hypothetical protein
VPSQLSEERKRSYIVLDIVQVMMPMMRSERLTAAQERTLRALLQAMPPCEAAAFLSALATVRTMSARVASHCTIQVPGSAAGQCTIEVPKEYS